MLEDTWNGIACLEISCRRVITRIKVFLGIARTKFFSSFSQGFIFYKRPSQLLHILGIFEMELHALRYSFLRVWPEYFFFWEFLFSRLYFLWRTYSRLYFPRKTFSITTYFGDSWNGIAHPKITFWRVLCSWDHQVLRIRIIVHRFLHRYHPHIYYIITTQRFVW